VLRRIRFGSLEIADFHVQEDFRQFNRTVFASGGVISKSLAGYEERGEQIEMAGAVHKALANGRHLVHFWPAFFLAKARTGLCQGLAAKRVQQVVSRRFWQREEVITCASGGLNLYCEGSECYLMGLVLSFRR